VKKISPTTWSILIAAIALFALLVLAASLNGMTFREGKPLVITKLAPNFAPGTESQMGKGFLDVLRVVMIIIWLMLPVYLVYLIISKEARKRLLRDILMLLPILILLYFISNNMNNQNAKDVDTGALGNKDTQAQEAQQPISTLPEFQPPAAWVTTVTSLVLALTLVGLVSFGVFLIWRRSRRKEDAPLRRIEIQAQQAIDSLDAGGDLREVIQRCYLQMVVAMHEYRMIRREQDMTPQEFEEILAKQGLPNEPVHQLTVLFEQVRYGAYNPGYQEESTAKSSLSAIISACQRIATRAHS
jgi:hypothetical protein